MPLHDTLIHDVADQVLPTVMQLLGSDTTAMNAAELRGYVRARAAGTVRAQVLRCMSGRQPAPSELESITDAVLERIVHRSIQGRCAPPVVAIPTPHVRLRRAA